MYVKVFGLMQEDMFGVTNIPWPTRYSGPYNKWKMKKNK